MFCTWEGSSMSRPASELGKADLAQFGPEIRRGLDQLMRAVYYAQELSSSLWDFAVEIDRLLALGVTTSDLRWLVKRGYLSHGREITVPQDANRRFEPPDQNLAFARNTCFVLTEAGRVILGAECTQPNQAALNHSINELPMTIGHDKMVASRQDGSFTDLQIDLPLRAMAGERTPPGTIPNWDKDSRTFLVGEHLIKRFRVPSPNQEAVLEAFQEEGWPASIDDPLTPVSDYEPKRRLRDTIKCLNVNQTTRLIRFRGDGTGQRVLWEFVPQSVACANSGEGRSLQRAA